MHAPTDPPGRLGEARVLTGQPDPIAPTDLPINEPEACPYLGIVDDPRTRFSFAIPAHRCHVGSPPSLIDLAHQGSYCLSSAFPTCTRYRASAAVIGVDVESGATNAETAVTSIPESSSLAAPWPGPSVPPGANIADAGPRLRLSMPTLMVADSWAVRMRTALPATTFMIRAKRLGVGGRVLLLLLLLTVAVVMLAIVTGSLGAVAPAPATHTAAATIAASPSASRAPSASSAQSPSSTTTAVPSPSSSTSSDSSSSPGPVQTVYIVKLGDSLTSIAAQYGVTPQAIRKANKIVDPNIIHVGRKLIIPLPPP